MPTVYETYISRCKKALSETDFQAIYDSVIETNQFNLDQLKTLCLQTVFVMESKRNQEHCGPLNSFIGTLKDATKEDQPFKHTLDEVLFIIAYLDKVNNPSESHKMYI